MTPESDPASYPPSYPTDQYRALIVTDPAIVAGARAANDDPSAPFSFRSQMLWLAGASGQSLEFTSAWLSRWETASSVGPELAPVAPRPQLRRVLVDAWLAASGISSEVYAGSQESEPQPSYDPGASARPDGGEPSAASEPAYDSPSNLEPSAPAAGGETEAPEIYPADPTPLPSWDHAPFALIAIVNRVDLATEACSGFAGELRFVYAAVDPSSRLPLDLTLIVEVPYPSTRPAAEWARAWSDLAALPAGEAYAAGLASLTREVQAEADPLRVRLRSNEIALSDPADRRWEMREFQLQIEGERLELVQVPLAFTPRADADPAELSAYVLDHAEQIEGAGAPLPESLRAGAAAIDTPDFSWDVLGVSERLRRAFSVQTCNGCHGGDTASLPFRHIGPGSSPRDPARLSRFLYDPDASTDELRRRTAVLEALSSVECDPAPAAGYPGK